MNASLAASAADRLVLNHGAAQLFLDDIPQFVGIRGIQLAHGYHLGLGG